MPYSFFNAANMCFNAIRENKILAKISEFTVIVLDAQSLYLYSYVVCASSVLL